jgi:hypothetical protein
MAEVVVESISPIENIELLLNGQVIGALKPAENAPKACLEKMVKVNRSGWLAARAQAQAVRSIRKPVPWAATMPVWVTVGHQPVRSGKDAQFFIDWLDRTLATAMGMQTSPEERQARALAERSLGVPPCRRPTGITSGRKKK